MTPKVKALVEAFLAKPKLATKSVKDIQRSAAGKGLSRGDIIEAKSKANQIFREQFGGQKEAIKAVSEGVKILETRVNSVEAEIGSLQSDVEDLTTKVLKFEEDTVKGTAEMTLKVPMSIGSEIQSKEDLIEKCKIDLDKWNIDKYIQNYWGNDNYPCWQVKLFLSPKTASQAEVITNLLATYKSEYVPLKASDILINPEHDRPVCVLISLADAHIDKGTLDRSTIEEKVKVYQDCLHNLIVRAYKAHKIDEIAFVIGNDFFTSDTYLATTTNGTPQDTSVSWNSAYEIGFNLMVESINKLKQLCNKLTVVHVPSNHGLTKEYYLAHALQVYFRADPLIVFDRSAEPSKVYTYKEVFIGMHHGDTNMTGLPGYFASKYYKEWGRCAHKEIALADKHHRKEWKLKMTGNEEHGVRMFIAPSLTSADLWHQRKLYDLARQAGICRIYDGETGYCGEFEVGVTQNK